MMSSQIDPLPDAAPLLADPDALRARWDRDGVLFFRHVVDRDAIARIRGEYLDRLKAVGVVDPASNEPVWNGKLRIDGALVHRIEDHVWQGLVAEPSLDRVVRTFLGEAPQWVPIVVHRSAPPIPAGAAMETFAARHQDGIYNYGIDFVTCWIPLMDIDDQVGGLAVVPGSHRGSLYAPTDTGNPDLRAGIPHGAIPDAAWRRGDYQAGDLLMFHSMTAHAGLPNRSDRFRLSTDIRFLPGSVARPAIGRVIRCDASMVALRDETGVDSVFAIDDRTIVRGPKGTPVTGDDRDGILFTGAEIIVVPSDRNSAKLIRSVSRKLLDLPSSWYETLPAGWVR